MFHRRFNFPPSNYSPRQLSTTAFSTEKNKYSAHFHKIWISLPNFPSIYKRLTVYSFDHSGNFLKKFTPPPRIYYRFPNDFTTTYPNSTSSKIVQYYQDDNWKNNNWKIKRKRERIFISPRNNIFNERNDQNHQDDASKLPPLLHPSKLLSYSHPAQRIKRATGVHVEGFVRIQVAPTLLPQPGTAGSRDEKVSRPTFRE